ncbi:nitroreductase family protein [Gorillibacterium sp. sgz5001074]|uniref:nitroreductase family protein n=1 Tax=Gorillibacterium sp. sgz5001074 TaxID=3446695 RepID=UPI003F67E098
MSAFTDLIQSRRSAMNFQEGIELPPSELEDMFTLTRLAPSAFNLQHAHYWSVSDPDKKEAVRQAAWNQYKVHTASAVIAVLGDKLAYRQAATIYEGLLTLGVIDQKEFDETVEMIRSMYEGREDFQRDEAIRNASLSAMQFMLIAKDKGWDTCPMIGFDPEALRQALDIPEHLVPVMLITIGKDSKKQLRPRGYRKPLGEFVRFL